MLSMRRENAARGGAEREKMLSMRRENAARGGAERECSQCVERMQRGGHRERMQSISLHLLLYAIETTGTGPSS